MYMPTLARFSSRDPLPHNGTLVGKMRVRQRLREKRVNRNTNSSYSYVANNPTNTIDPSGQQPGNDDDPVGRRMLCNVRICVNPVDLGGGHLYIVAERTVNDESVEWAYRGGPGYDETRGENCDCTETEFGQLIGTQGEYNDDFVDYVEPKDENCKEIVISAPKCEDIHDCFVDVLHRVDECCIEYSPVPAPLGLGGKCNSNCVVGWMLKLCISPKGFVDFLPLPPGRIIPGVQVPVPRCVRDPAKDVDANNGDCKVCGSSSATPM